MRRGIQARLEDKTGNPISSRQFPLGGGRGTQRDRIKRCSSLAEFARELHRLPRSAAPFLCPHVLRLTEITNKHPIALRESEPATASTRPLAQRVGHSLSGWVLSFILSAACLDEGIERGLFFPPPFVGPAIKPSFVPVDRGLFQ